MPSNAGPAKFNRRAYHALGKVVLTVFLAFFTFLSIFPLFWLLSTSLRTGMDVYRVHLFPEKVLFDSYEYILMHSPFLIWFKNSVLVSLAATVVSLVVASLAAYSMSRFVTPWKRFISKSILMAYMFPGVLLLLPLFVLFVKLRLLDRQLGLMLAYSMSNLPFAMWLLVAYFETIPKELDEAARIDGANNNYIFWRMIMPIAAPGLATSAIFVFINAWNEFVLALVLIQSDMKKTLPIGLYATMGGKGGEWVFWDDRMANSAMVILPMLIVFFALNKYITKGLTAGALKG
jgi:ABC-type glycerol-3-phosphate transport system permease component